MRNCRCLSTYAIIASALLISQQRLVGQSPAESAAENSTAVDYARDVRPILKTKCATCHNEAEPSGGLRLDVAQELMKGGDTGPIIVPGKSSESLLIHAVMHTSDLKMPPPEEAKPLDDAQISVLRRWIDAGAVIPENDSLVTHWAFQKPIRPTLSAITNPVDAFVAQQHQHLKLKALAQAPNHVQLRRLYIDVTGLPPTPEQLEAFLADKSDHAWEKVVDELLASPHYGERWGRHWMDIWRYSDWDGYGAEVRESKPHIWRWRDWIIESLNGDKSYDRMILEMLAADEIAPDDPSALRATGYLVRNWYVFNRNTWLDNTIEHTGKAFMGLTFNCARCHDHMYDPISQPDYYQLRAFFEPHDVRTDRLPGQSDVTKDGLVRVFDANTAAQTQLFVRGDEKNPLKDKSIVPRVPAGLGFNGSGELNIQPVELPASAYYPGLQDHIAAEELARTESAAQSASTALHAARQTQESAQARLAAFRQSGSEPASRTPFFTEAFSASRPDVWSTGAGQWTYQDGHLSQRDPADAFCHQTTLQPHPADFTARLRFRPTGGDVYKSVGIAFDLSDDQNFSFVYASAGSSKLQVAHRVQGGDQYPPTGTVMKTIELNKDHELLIEVLGTELKVSFNGEMALTYVLPNPRPAAGRFQIWTYDATADFLNLEINNHADISEAGLQTALAQAEAAAATAEQKMAVAVAEQEFARARIAADQANYSVPPASDSKERSLAAGRAERTLAVETEKLKLLTAQQTLKAAEAALSADNSSGDQQKVKAVADAQAAVMTSMTAVETAQKSVLEPFDAYTRFTPVYPSTSSGRRTALARWITDRENPLTARVAVNHIWLRHFHQPLVPTVFDFGVNGKAPTHPELLDWLACEFMDNGWSMKHIHRLILTSQTYRRASSPAAVERDLFAMNTAADPENRFLWRQNVYRMEAEVVRDATLHVAGQLDTQMFGPDLDPASGLTLGRRSVYFRTSKEKKMTFLSTFDSPNPVECYQRAESISPQQSLAMSNSPLTLGQSRIIAAKITEELSAVPENEQHSQFVKLAFWRVLNRVPDPDELQTCVHFLEEQATRLSKTETLTAFSGNPTGVDGGAANNFVKPSSDAGQRSRENLIHVLLNHNDFVTVR